jgi:hypothetical protein
VTEPLNCSDCRHVRECEYDLCGPPKVTCSHYEPRQAPPRAAPPADVFDPLGGPDGAFLDLAYVDCALPGYPGDFGHH